MAEHTEVFGICENLCRVPVYAKSQIDEKLEHVGGSMIRVTFDAEFAGHTITFEMDGMETITRTVPTSGARVIEFSTMEIGTLTINDAVASRSMSVEIIAYSMYELEFRNTVDITFTVQSAAVDTVYYYPNNDTTKDEIILCTTDVNGQGTGHLSVIPDSSTLTFYSSVAKDTSTGTNIYSKSITLDENTSEILVMPDGALYWYGNQCVWISGGYRNITSFKPDGVTSLSVVNPTLNTHSVSLQWSNREKVTGGLTSNSTIRLNSYSLVGITFVGTSNYFGFSTVNRPPATPYTPYWTEGTSVKNIPDDAKNIDLYVLLGSYSWDASSVSWTVSAFWLE